MNDKDRAKLLPVVLEWRQRFAAFSKLADGDSGKNAQVKMAWEDFNDAGRDVAFAVWEALGCPDPIAKQDGGAK